MEIINWRLISHPLNWVTLFLMVFIALFLFHMVADWTSGKQKSNANVPTAVNSGGY